jgi:hypothetical protein
MGKPKSSDVWASIEAKLMAHVEVRECGCWIWTGTKDSWGYGRMGWQAI